MKTVERVIKADGLGLMPEYITVRPLRETLDEFIAANQQIKDRWKYVGLSLDEIRKKYGKEAAKDVYTAAVTAGIDLTRPPAIHPNSKTIQTATITAEAKDRQWNIWIEPSVHHSWASRKLALSGRYDLSADYDNWLDHVLNIYIDRVIERLSKRQAA